MASRLSITPSPLPPFSGRSKTASALYPLGSSLFGWSVKLPKSSFPLSITPLPLRSSAKKALPSPPVVHDKRSGLPLPLMSKRTPSSVLVKWNPFPLASIMIGLHAPGGQHPPPPPPPPPHEGGVWLAHG